MKSNAAPAVPRRNAAFFLPTHAPLKRSRVGKQRDQILRFGMLTRTFLGFPHCELAAWPV